VRSVGTCSLGSCLCYAYWTNFTHANLSVHSVCPNSYMSVGRPSFARWRDWASRLGAAVFEMHFMLASCLRKHKRRLFCAKVSIAGSTDRLRVQVSLTMLEREGCNVRNNKPERTRHPNLLSVPRAAVHHLVVPQALRTGQFRSCCQWS
jgi:hypothetical protein